VRIRGPTDGLQCKSTVYGLNGRHLPIQTRGMQVLGLLG